MNVTVERGALAAAMGRLSNIVDRKLTIQILTNVLLEAAGDRLQIRATNLDMEAIESIPAIIAPGGEGCITVPTDTLSEISRILPVGAQVNLALDGVKIVVTSGRSKFSLPTLAADMFPSVWSTEWTTEIGITGEQLAAMLKRVAHAQDDTMAYAYLMGVHAQCYEGRLRMVATDRNVIAYVDGPEVGEFRPVTIPSRMVAEMGRLTGDLIIGMTESLISVRNDESAITSKLVDASLKFPDYHRAIPKSSPRGAVINVASITSAIRRAMIARDPTKREQAIRLGFMPGGLSVTARNTVADAMDEIDIEYEGEEVAIPLDPQNLLEILETITSESVCLAFDNSKAPLVWVAPGDTDSLAAIMPLRIG